MRKMITTLCAVAMLAMAVNAMAGDMTDEVVSQKKVGFHCNTCKPGGGDVSDNVKWFENENSEGVWYLGHANKPTPAKITLIHLTEDVWVIKPGQGTFVCQGCGNSDWVSYSNKDGEFDGKNVQLYCHGAPTPEFGKLEVETECIVTPATKVYQNTLQRNVQEYQEWAWNYSPAYSSVTATTDAQLDLLVFNPKNGNVDNKDKNFNNVVVPNANHFTFAQLDVADLEVGVDLVLVVGNKFDEVGSAFVQLVDGVLEITIDGVYDATVGAVAFSKLPAPKNGNIHSMAEFKHNNELSIPCPAGNTIYLYIHFANLQYDLGEGGMISSKDVFGEYQIVETELVRTEYGESEPADCDCVTFTISDNDGKEVLEGIVLVGQYTVVFTHDCDDTTATQVKSVAKDGITVFTYTAEHFEYTEPNYLDPIKLSDNRIEPPVITWKSVIVK